ncbi:hypothetical protein ACF1A9_01350 [Streptomyces sp. NPDC014872]|uniref:hypothetical protein n=1 Tax=unclassified Streptomyces TaxID=2593676 RepID=UPI0036FA309E
MLRHAIAPVRFFSQVSNEILRHPRLSSDAVRILTWQLSLPADADESLSRTGERAGIKKAAFSRAKAQLKEEGYVHEWRQQGLRGLWATVQLVSSVPLTAEQAVAARDGHPTAACPAAGQPKGRVAGRHPEKTSGGKTSSPPPLPAPAPAAEAVEAEAGAETQTRTEVRQAPDAAQELVDSITALDPRLNVPRGMLPQLAALASQWLDMGHTADDVRAAVRRSLPGMDRIIHRPGGLLRYVLCDPRPARTPATPARPAVSASPPRLSLMRECAGVHTQPFLFLPVGDEECCGSCQDKASQQDQYVTATARGVAAVRAGLSGRPARR